MLTKRLSRLFKADMHAVLDCIEEPASLLKQSLREMESTIENLYQLIQTQQLEQKNLQTRLKEFESETQNLKSELNICFDADNEILIRATLKKILEKEKIYNLLRQKLIQSEDRLQRLRKQHSEYMEQHESIKQKAQLYTDIYQDSADKKQVTWPAKDIYVSDDEVEIALLQEKNIRSK